MSKLFVPCRLPAYKICLLVPPWRIEMDYTYVRSAHSYTTSIVETLSLGVGQACCLAHVALNQVNSRHGHSAGRGRKCEGLKMLQLIRQKKNSPKCTSIGTGLGEVRYGVASLPARRTKSYTYTALPCTLSRMITRYTESGCGQRISMWAGSLSTARLA